MEKLFVDGTVNCFHGEEAQKKLAEKNDLQFLTPEGILSVSEARWKEAQVYERRTWMELNSFAKDDHNGRNSRDLDNYSFLNGRSFKRMIEVGCGPFTNTRHILPLIKVEEVTLLDPLLDTYLQHTNCTYREKVLYGQPVQTISSSIEDFIPEGTFDLVVMINVLQHCKDAGKIFNILWDMLDIGGTIVFREHCIKPGVWEENALYDSGHPLLVGYDYMNRFLGRFKENYRREVPGTDGFTDRIVCFSGIK